MKTVPKIPFLQNIVEEYQHQGCEDWYSGHYREWLRQFGFAVPIRGDYLEFPDDFPDEELCLFILRWS